LRQSRSAELVLTFDNLGEATELERRGRSSSVGAHPSVTEALPWLLDALGDAGLTATFFVEAINCELYPDAVREIAARGHELGMHGWRHEDWGELAAARERSILKRSRWSFGSLGIEVSGFRPPGGELTASSVELLREVGVRWCSPAGGEFGVRGGLAWVPFEWELVDAYHLMSEFSELRVSRGDASEPLSAGSLTKRFGEAVQAVARSGSRATLILHPFLVLDLAWRRGAGELLAEVGALSRRGDLWVGPGEALVSCAEGG
jgi:peptidoglycan/xylan/chitin deacetylase (PgdA/CDA1 family)